MFTIVHEKTRTGNWDSDANAMQLALNTFTIGCAAEAESLPGPVSAYPIVQMRNENVF